MESFEEFYHELQQAYPEFCKHVPNYAKGKGIFAFSFPIKNRNLPAEGENVSPRALRLMENISRRGISYELREGHRGNGTVFLLFRECESTRHFSGLSEAFDEFGSYKYSLESMLHELNEEEHE